MAAAALLVLINEFTAAKVAQAEGGKAATATKNSCRLALTDALRDLAFYVQLACGNNLTTLLDSGFEVSSTNRAQTMLAKPVITRIQAQFSGEAMVTVAPISNARCFELRVAELGDDNLPGPFREAVVSPSARNMRIGELVPGRLCVFQVRAVGGSAGHSEWSDAVVQRAA